MVYGYTSRKGCRQNLFYNKDGMLVYHAAALGIVYDKDKHEQYFFHGGWRGSRVLCDPCAGALAPCVCNGAGARASAADAAPTARHRPRR